MAFRRSGVRTPSAPPWFSAPMKGFMAQTISLTVNGQARTVTTDPERPLLDVLREELQLTGAKYGCGEGQCRACTVLLNGKSVAACITRSAMPPPKRFLPLRVSRRET